MQKIDPSKLKFSIEGKEYIIEIPKSSDIQIREFQNLACNRQHHICGLFRGQLICLEVNPKADKDGSVDLGAIRVCKHNPEKRLRL